MIRRTALLLGALALTLSTTVACHVSATCDVHRDSSGSCTVTVPPGGVDVTVITTVAGTGPFGGGGQASPTPPPLTTTRPPTTTKPPTTTTPATTAAPVSPTN